MPSAVTSSIAAIHADQQPGHRAVTAEIVFTQLRQFPALLQVKHRFGHGPRHRFARGLHHPGQVERIGAQHVAARLCIVAHRHDHRPLRAGHTLFAAPREVTAKFSTTPVTRKCPPLHNSPAQRVLPYRRCSAKARVTHTGASVGMKFSTGWKSSEAKELPCTGCRSSASIAAASNS